MVDAIFALSVAPDLVPLCSISNTRTSKSPAAVTRVRSLECGMNFTEKIFAVWPVATVVVREKGVVDDPGWYVCILRCWSSLPDASKRPDVDQLRVGCKSLLKYQI